ncbi:hypothetical protein DXG01_002776 [Tephrocybe rancida]|nr:hypothetical protein DXG01_002776 [Tephrocybe rancida]
MNEILNAYCALQNIGLRMVTWMLCFKSNLCRAGQPTSWSWQPPSRRVDGWLECVEEDINHVKSEVEKGELFYPLLIGTTSDEGQCQEDHSGNHYVTSQQSLTEFTPLAIMPPPAQSLALVLSSFTPLSFITMTSVNNNAASTRKLITGEIDEKPIISLASRGSDSRFEPTFNVKGEFIGSPAQYYSLLSVVTKTSLPYLKPIDSLGLSPIEQTFGSSDDPRVGRASFDCESSSFASPQLTSTFYADRGGEDCIQECIDRAPAFPFSHIVSRPHGKDNTTNTAKL